MVDERYFLDLFICSAEQWEESQTLPWRRCRRLTRMVSPLRLEGSLAPYEEIPSRRFY